MEKVMKNKLDEKLESEKENRKYIAIISFLRKIIRVFFTLFFNIYILQIAGGDLNFVIKYTIFSVFVEVIIYFVILKVINSKNIKYMYRSSFIMLLLCIALLIGFKENIIKYIYLFKTLEKITEHLYALPYELMIIQSNNKKTMSNYIANLNILTSISTILTPVLSGFIIEKFSYYMLFVILMIEVIVILFISFKIKDFEMTDKKFELKKFFKVIKDKKHMHDIYNCMFFRRISSQGAIVELLPIVLFFNLKTELDFGIYNSIFAVIAIVSLEVLKIINTKKIKKKSLKNLLFVPMSIVIFLASLVMIYNTNFITLMIYYILMNSFGAIIESESCSLVYESIRLGSIEKYKKEHVFTYNLYMTFGKIISYVLVYILYNYFNNVNILSISICILMFFLIISSMYLKRVDKYIARYGK